MFANLSGFFDNLFESVRNVVGTVQPLDLIDIAIIAFVIYKLIQLIRETRAGQLIKGILFLIVVYSLSRIFELKVIQFVIKNILDIGILAFAIIFQPELRRILEKFGQTTVTAKSLFGFTELQERLTLLWYTGIDEICEACDELSTTFTGALIVIERQTRLGEQISTGTVLNSPISKELLGNIFYPKTPLHDGAAIIRDGIIIAAACFLPKPQNEEQINKKLGSRHRAAIGMSENSDAVIIIVSEETGFISIAYNGVLERNVTTAYLKKYLMDILIPKSSKSSSKKLKKLKQMSESIIDDIDVHQNIDKIKRD